MIYHHCPAVTSTVAVTGTVFDFQNENYPILIIFAKSHFNTLNPGVMAFSTTDMWHKDKKQKAELHISMAMSLFDLSSDIWAKALPILCLWIIAQVIIYIFLYYATYVCTMQVNLYTEKVKSFFFIPHPIVFKATFTHLVWVIHTHFHVRWYNQWKI